MAFTRKPTQPPDMDTKSFVKRIREVTAKTGLGPFSVFDDAYLPAFHRWVRGESEFDGTGLRDVVNANAYALDDLKADFDSHRTMDNARHSLLSQRITALEAAGGGPSVPFPGGS